MFKKSLAITSLEYTTIKQFNHKKVCFPILMPHSMMIGWQVEQQRKIDFKNVAMDVVPLMAAMLMACECQL
eukprot:12951913-Ditylum_brightwellii.AAC.1